MSDLIRREDVIKLVNQFVFGVRKEQIYESKKAFIKYIEKIPTAYSVDKIVAELEKLKDKGSVTKTEKLITKACVNKAIEIVKAGVKNE